MGFSFWLIVKRYPAWKLRWIVAWEGQCAPILPPLRHARWMPSVRCSAGKTTNQSKATIQTNQTRQVTQTIQSNPPTLNEATHFRRNDNRLDWPAACACARAWGLRPSCSRSHEWAPGALQEAISWSSSECTQAPTLGCRWDPAGSGLGVWFGGKDHTVGGLRAPPPVPTSVVKEGERLHFVGH